MQLLTVVFLVCVLKEVFTNKPVTFIFKRQFGFDPDLLKTKCNGDQAEAVSRIKNDLIEAIRRISYTVKERLTNQTTWVELNDLTNQHCDKNENLKFLSQKLVENAQKCLKNSLDGEKESDFVREFVSNSCAAIYNEYHLKG